MNLQVENYDFTLQSYQVAEKPFIFFSEKFTEIMLHLK